MCVCRCRLEGTDVGPSELMKFPNDPIGTTLYSFHSFGALTDRTKIIRTFQDLIGCALNIEMYAEARFLVRSCSKISQTRISR